MVCLQIHERYHNSNRISTGIPPPYSTPRLLIFWTTAVAVTVVAAAVVVVIVGRSRMGTDKEDNTRQVRKKNLRSVRMHQIMGRKVH